MQLFNGTFQRIIAKANVNGLKRRLEHFFLKVCAYLLVCWYIHTCNAYSIYLLLMPCVC